MAPPLLNSTMAAGLKPFLRASVNAVRGRPYGRNGPAKIGNAITIYGDWPRLPDELRGTEAATRNRAGERAAGSRLFTSQVALHDGTAL
jgi:hypothetical protein